jgi:transcription termination factor Rho
MSASFDSITVLARAHNAVVPHSVKILPAVWMPTHCPAETVLGAARNRRGGSLTSSPPADRHQPRDEVIFEDLRHGQHDWF